MTSVMGAPDQRTELEQTLRAAITLSATEQDAHGALDELLAVLAERDAQVAELRAALRPFADATSWHHNFDGRGLIFIPDGAFYEKDIRAAIDVAAEVLVATEENP